MPRSTISRREVIRKAGIAGAAAWAAPMLTTATASAATSKKKCSSGGACGQQPVLCKGSIDNPQCICTPDVGGKNRCFGCLDLKCGAFPVCAENSDCPKGSKCTPGCCKKPVCVPLCGKACPASSDARPGPRWHRVRTR